MITKNLFKKKSSAQKLLRDKNNSLESNESKT